MDEEIRYETEEERNARWKKMRADQEIIDNAIKNATPQDVDVTSPPTDFLYISSKLLDVLDAMNEYAMMLEEYKKQYEELNDDHFKNRLAEVIKAIKIVEQAEEQFNEIDHCVPCKEMR